MFLIYVCSVLFLFTIISAYNVSTRQKDPNEMHECWIKAIIVGDKRLFAWRGDGYKGGEVGGWGACRYWDTKATYYGVFFDHYGGYDAGIAMYTQPRGLREVYTDAAWRNQYMQAKYTVSKISSDKKTYSGNFYMGPKTGILSTRKYKGLEYNYECYIIEYSSRSVTGFKEWLTTTGGYRVSASRHNGEVYSHWRRNHKNIYQIFSVRNSWRPNGGRTDVMQIAKNWLDLGLIQRKHAAYYLQLWRHNFETEGRIKGHIKFSDITLVNNEP